MENESKNRLLSLINKDKIDAVLFSGDINSLIELYEIKKNNKAIISITVALEKYDHDYLENIKYSTKELNVNYINYLVSENKILEKIDEAINISKSYSLKEIIKTLNLIFAIEFAKDIGLKRVISGEESSDITKKVARHYELEAVMPFRDKQLLRSKNNLLDLTNKYNKKFSNLIIRNNNNSSGIHKILENISNNISKEEFDEACNKYHNFNNKIDYYLFKKYNERFGYEKRRNNMKEISGAEIVLIHDNKIVLGMQKEKRWYLLDDNKRGAIVKTIGGEIEKIDNDSLDAAKRELFEEIENISISNIKIKNEIIFEKEITMKDMNPFDNTSNLKMHADFYQITVDKEIPLNPNDLPCLFEIPIKEFLKLSLNEIIEYKEIEKYKSNKENIDMPEYITLFIPEEVKKYLKNKIRGAI